jgi:hypothetical protein
MPRVGYLVTMRAISNAHQSDSSLARSLCLIRVYDDDGDWFEGENQVGVRGTFPSACLELPTFDLMCCGLLACCLTFDSRK